MNYKKPFRMVCSLPVTSAAWPQDADGAWVDGDELIALLNNSPLGDDKPCRCRRCIRERGDTINGFPREMCEMICCTTCGNKRCPHSDDHRNTCTNSNEPGQVGSRYGVFKPAAPNESEEAAKVVDEGMLNRACNAYDEAGEDFVNEESMRAALKAALGEPK